MSTRDDIIRELKLGETPYQLSKKYPRASVYRLYNELLQSGQLADIAPQIIDGTIIPDDEDDTGQQTSATPTATQVKAKAPIRSGADIVSFGADTLPLSVIERIRGVLGITLRPKVLSCPMPELLYPAMVIAVTELGFRPQRPDDFIDTVLYQWLEACDILPYAFIKRSELEEMVSKSVNIDKYARERGFMTEDEFIQKYQRYSTATRNIEALQQDEGADDIPEDLEEMADEMEQEIDEAEERDEAEIAEFIEPGIVKENSKLQPHKPTVGELLAKLNITNIQKEVDENGGRQSSTKPTDS